LPARIQDFHGEGGTAASAADKQQFQQYITHLAKENQIMPKVSSAPEDAFHFKGGFADGWGEILSAKALVFQFPPDKDTGRQNPPGLFACLEIQRHNDGEGSKSAEQPSEVLLSIQSAGKDTGTLDACHPGNYPNDNPELDPVDVGGELGAEGNTLFAVQDGYQLNDKTKWMSFTASLQEKGFKPAVLKRTFFPDLVGLRAYFKTETRKKFRDDQTADPTVFVVTEIKQFPYEKGAVKATAKKAGAPAAAKAAAPAASAPTPPVAGDLSAEDIATAIITDTLAPAQKGAVLPDIKKLKILSFMAINKHKPAVPAEMKKLVQEQLGDEEWLVAIGEATGLFQVEADNRIQFAS
jgi:hypothetical protein